MKFQLTNEVKHGSSDQLFEFLIEKMSFSQKCSCTNSLFILRSLSTSSVLESTHYKALGLNTSATHDEIKAAYYELSKKHHPDKNQGSEKSARLFRAITEAYEVLGNKKLREQYDKEQRINKISHNSFMRGDWKADYGDDIERYFYERTKKKPRYYGKTAYYDYDAWYKAHYSVDQNWNKYYRSDVDSVKNKTFVYKGFSSKTSGKWKNLSPKLKLLLGFIIVVFFFTYRKLGPGANN